jgi:hypothetical protein
MKKGFKGNIQSSVSSFSNSNTQEDLHQQNAYKQDLPFACGDKQLCGGRIGGHWSIYVCHDYCNG